MVNCAMRSWDDSVCQPGVFTIIVVTGPSVKGRQHATLQCRVIHQDDRIAVQGLVLSVFCPGARQYA